MPDVAGGYGAVHVLKEFFGVVAGVEDAVIVADQLFARILADGAELFVYIGDGALHIGDGHDRVLVQSELLVGEFFEHLF